MKDPVAITLVPVEVFGAGCDCHTEGDKHCGGWGYGLMDAVSVWSDCNRAIGKIYRVEEPGDWNREPGDTMTVWVERADLPWFEKRFGDEEDPGTRPDMPQLTKLIEAAEKAQELIHSEYCTMIDHGGCARLEDALKPFREAASVR